MLDAPVGARDTALKNRGKTPHSRGVYSPVGMDRPQVTLISTMETTEAKGLGIGWVGRVCNLN